MKTTFSCILLSIFCLAFSNFALAHDHREHGAHVHGSAKMNIAFDGLVGKVELEGPGDSFIGFEHKAETIADKKAQSLAVDTLEKNIAGIVVFDPSLNCVWTKDRIEVNYEEGGHSDIDASWSLKCQKALVATKIKFNMQKFFPRVHDLDLQILADSIQVSGEAKTSGTEITVK